MLFYLGTHHPAWLGHIDVPLFVSRRTLAQRRTLPRARAAWALDSGGFSELSLHGKWTVEPRRYVDEVRRFRSEIGQMDWAAIQDWMCEPVMLARTGLSIEEHQRRTITSFLRLRDLAPDLPWLPVVQGWVLADYHRHVDAYLDVGVDLASFRRVGLGSVCRRQATSEAATIVTTLAKRGLSLHGFGFKVGGLARVHQLMGSSDSLAWSLQARRRAPLEGHTGHKNCANCPAYALRWRARLMRSI